MYNNGKEINGTCKRMSTIFNRLEKLVSDEVDTIYNNAVKAINLVKSEFNDNKYCTYSSYKYNNVCVSVNIVECDNNITYTIVIDVDFEFETMCKSRYAGMLLREYIDGKHTNETDSTKENNKTTDNKTTDNKTTDNTNDNETVTNNEVYATTTKIIVRDVCNNDEVCTITPYENGKELTTPISKMKCLTSVIDYVTRLYDMNVVTRETYFTISRVGKRNVVLTYTNTHNIVQYYNISDKMQSLATTAIEAYGYYSKYTRKPLKSRQYDVLKLYKKGIYLTISQCNDDENVIKDWYCDIIYKTAHHMGQYTYNELLHLIAIIRFNTQEYCDKYFD